jgi:hypothetical protein
VAVKWHNLPSLPNFVRAGNGLAFGTVPHLLEPLWSYLPEFIGDDFYRCSLVCVPYTPRWGVRFFWGGGEGGCACVCIFHICAARTSLHEVLPHA